MSKTEGDPLGPGFAHRLRLELDRVRPRYSEPRYATIAPRRVGVWRLAPVALVISVGALVALTASVATGSTNPVVWTEEVVTKIHSEPATLPSATPDDRPGPPAAAAPAARAPVRSSSAAPTQQQQGQPSDQPHDSESPEPRESPEPHGTPRPSPWSSPWPSPSGDH